MADRRLTPQNADYALVQLVSLSPATVLAKPSIDLDDLTATVIRTRPRPAASRPSAFDLRGIETKTCPAVASQVKLRYRGRPFEALRVLDQVRARSSCCERGAAGLTGFLLFKLSPISCLEITGTVVHTDTTV